MTVRVSVERDVDHPENGTRRCPKEPSELREMTGRPRGSAPFDPRTGASPSKPSEPHYFPRGVPNARYRGVSDFTPVAPYRLIVFRDNAHLPSSARALPPSKSGRAFPRALTLRNLYFSRLLHPRRLLERRMNLFSGY